MDISLIATVTVTYEPSIDILRTHLCSLPSQNPKLVVDNASAVDKVTAIETLVANTPNTHLIQNESNIGLAGAINLGVQAIRHFDPQAQFVLLLDQDSEALEGSIASLMDGYSELKARDNKVGAVGPLLLDIDTGLTHGFHQCTRWRWKRIYPEDISDKVISCSSLNGSGTLVPIDLFLELNGLDQTLFIDHVDTEWSFRMIAAGYSLWGIPSAVFYHRMGQRGIRYWYFGWRVWPSRPPYRHYFLFRNAIIMMQRSYVPNIWKFWAAVKLILTACIHGLFDSQRSEQLNCIWRGLRDGIHSKEKQSS